MYGTTVYEIAKLNGIKNKNLIIIGQILKIPSKLKYFSKYTGSSVSIVDALKAIKEQSSYDYRSKVAEVNGIKNYAGTSAQNIKLLDLLKSGKLIKP